MAADPNALAVTQVAYDAGFRGPQLRTAVALALAESSGNPMSHNDNARTGDDSYGLWQINYFGGLRPSRTKQFGEPGSLIGTDPTGKEAHANARAAYALSGGGKNWQPWQADFNNGRYYTHLPAAEAAVQQFGASTGTSVGNPTGILGALGSNLSGKTDVTATDPAVPADVNKANDDACFIHPKLSLPGPIPNIDFCLLDAHHARAIGGVMFMIAGAFISLVGVALLTGKSVDVSALVGKTTPEGWIAGAVASRKQNKTDRDVEHAGRQAASIDKEGQSRRARAAFRGTSYGMHDEPF